ncbi:beta-galactosidase/beta-glucuronidase [Amycolatopsis bartoniae]|uniref:Hydrolase n=1 Tax=Amycolatopsis bartoniae TaxID=941986 RepID=A0A8H9IWN7_9PSEU|nr:glycoside hydrolase family 2 TIM barrel-domain containing protein [Amycolatopsis bartoniae]MBB2938492.1 beta-galactosidase/beta-glucuronidase [Amycolatopsis bartoniae]TVT10360.1 glycoside hydrolase family 2 [Amycolatopsis bartoniae]GHF70630.1 hydrolase [Amycolatopsis bartoniae]
MTIAENAADPLVAEAVPRPEYPRPDRDRSAQWLSLNGRWRFTADDGAPASITVPFAWETAASGVRRTWLEHGVYSRTVTVPDEWAGRRVVLCFGAVHHRAAVSVDGLPVGEHVGGHSSFEFDVTGVLEPGRPAELTVEVDAPADKREIPHGKQRSIPRDDYDGVSFTPTSGIWQSVWLEARGRTYVADVSVRGDSLTGFDIAGELAGDAPGTARVVALLEGHETVLPVAGGRFEGRLEVGSPRLWSPESPHVYSIALTVGEGREADRLTVTGGLRRIETRGEALYLNGERLYVRGVLDQGYWPETGLTAPDGETLVRDLDLARELGFSLVRKHLKFEEPRWLDHADRTGMLVWAEPPCPSRFSPAAVAGFEAQLPDLVRRDGNHPSIVIWGLYNEEWGLDWDIPGSPERAAAATHAYDLMRSLDDTRPIVENSGWAHVKTDLVDWHYYDEDPRAWAENLAALASGERETFEVKLSSDFVVDKSFYGSPGFPRSGVPILNSEFGAGFTSLERAWHVRWQTQEIRRHDRFAGYIYTELTDVEHEMAGLLDAHRRPKDWGGLNPADAFAPTTLVVDLVPAHAGADIAVPAGPLTLDVHVSHTGRTPVTGTLHAAWGASGSRGLPAVAADSRAVRAEPFRLSAAVPLTVPAPGGPARLHLWLVAGDRVAARTFVDAAVVEELNRRGGRD